MNCACYCLALRTGASKEEVEWIITKLVPECWPQEKAEEAFATFGIFQQSRAAM